MGYGLLATCGFQENTASDETATPEMHCVTGLPYNYAFHEKGALRCDS